MSAPQVSRRSVARGAAWSIPLVAVSVAAPAFAASGGPANVTSITVCQCAGGSDKQYRVTVTFSNASTDQYDLTNVVITEGGVPVVTQTPSTGTVAPGPTSIVTFVVRRQSNGSTGTFGISYTATKHNTTTSFTGSFTTPGAINATNACATGCA